MQNQQQAATANGAGK